MRRRGEAIMALADAYRIVFDRHVALIERWERESPAHVATMLDATGDQTVREYLSFHSGVFAAPAYLALDVGIPEASDLLAEYDELSLLAAAP
jgi:hypothetical protein